MEESKPKLRHAPSRPKRGKENPYYVGTNELKEEIRKYFESSDIPEERVISNRLGEMLIKIATRYASKPCFSGYYYKSEFISEAIYRMILKLGKIDLSHPKCNPFSYLTCICYCVFIATIKRHNTDLERLRKLRSAIYEDFCLTESINIKKELGEFITSTGDMDKEEFKNIAEMLFDDNETSAKSR